MISSRLLWSEHEACFDLFTPPHNTELRFVSLEAGHESALSFTPKVRFDTQSYISPQSQIVRDFVIAALSILRRSDLDAALTTRARIPKPLQPFVHSRTQESLVLQGVSCESCVRDSIDAMTTQSSGLRLFSSPKELLNLIRHIDHSKRQVEIRRGIVTNEMIHTLLSYRHLRELAIFECKLSPDAFLHVSKANVERMSIECSNAEEAITTMSCSNESLRALSFRGMTVGRVLPEFVQLFPRLKCLDLSFTNVNDDDLAHMPIHSSIEYVNLGCSEVSPKGICDCTALPKLTAIGVSCIPRGIREVADIAMTLRVHELYARGCGLQVQDVNKLEASHPSLSLYC